MNVLSKSRKYFLLIFLVCFSSIIVSSQSLQKLYESYEEHAAQEDWKSATKVLDSLLILDPNNNYWLIDKAKMEAILNHKKSAIEYVSKAIANGYCDVGYLGQSSDFENIQQEKEFKTRVEELEHHISQYKLIHNTQEIVIDVPPMMECYVIMLYLGNPNHPLINSRKQHFYFKAIDKYFSVFKNHPSLLALKKQYPGNKKEWINNLRAHHNLRTLYYYDGLDINKIVKFPVERDTLLAQLVKDFAEATNFKQFYKENAEFYEAMKKVMITNYSFGSKIIPFFNDNFEQQINRFNIYFSPIYGGWQHGPKVELDSYLECFYFGGIMYTNKKRFYYPDVNLLFTFITEFDHTPINALSATYSEDLLKYKSKTSKLNNTGHVSYGNINSTINEYLTWAFALHYFYEHTPNEYDELKSRIVRTMENGRGFIKFNDFMLFYEQQYIHNRAQYPMMKDFYPEILRWLEEL